MESLLLIGGLMAIAVAFVAGLMDRERFAWLFYASLAVGFGLVGLSETGWQRWLALGIAAAHLVVMAAWLRKRRAHAGRESVDGSVSSAS